MTDSLDYPFPVTLDAVIVHYSDVERLIKDVYGKEVSIPACFEMGNDSYVNQDLSGATPEGWDLNGIAKDIEEWIESYGEWINLESVMADLVFKGILPAKNYMIEVYW